MPCWERLAARLTAVVVLPTPPFWFATVMIRQRLGRGQSSRPPRAPTAASAARPIGVSAAVAHGASGTTTCDSGTEVGGCEDICSPSLLGVPAVITAPGVPRETAAASAVRTRSDPGTRGPSGSLTGISFASSSIETCPAGSEDTRISRCCGQPSPGTPAARAVPSSGHPTPTALSTCSLLSAVSSHNDADNRCRRYDPTVTGLQNLRTPHAKSGQNRLRRLQFRRRRLPLDREQLATGAQQGRGPADEPVERRHRAGRRHVGADTRRGLILGPGPEHGRVGQIERADALLEKNRATQQRLEQHHLNTGPKHRQDDPRQSGP